MEEVNSLSKIMHKNDLMEEFEEISKNYEVTDKDTIF